MSLDNPNRLERVIAWWRSFPHKGVVGYCFVALIAIGGFLFLYDRIDAWWTDRGIRKEQEKVANTLKEISNTKLEQERLKLQEEAQRRQLETDIQELANQTYGREEAKKEANQALANYLRDHNSNTNATAQDLKDALEKLK